MKRMRRLRTNPTIRDMVAETRLDRSDFIYPLFIEEGQDKQEPIPSMPGIDRFSIDRVLPEIKELLDLGINQIMLFGIPDHKDAEGSGAWHDDGIIQRAIREIKDHYPDMYIVTDVCMCEYTDSGHCGIIDETGYVQNDLTVDYLARISTSYARAGADMIAPSDMMDGRIGAIREALDEEGFINTPIMAYSAKYCSNFYGPFRDAADSAPQFGDRKQYQMDYRNQTMAMQEIEADLEEGADIIMVKPALAYLDVIQRAHEEFEAPLAAYMVSGEYSMLKNAILQGLMKEEVAEESLIAIKRAGAKIIINYFAKDLAKKWREEGR